MKNHIKWTIVKASFTYKTWNNQNISFFYYCFFQPSNQGSLAKRLLTWIVGFLNDHQNRILLNFLYLVKYANYQSVSGLTGNLTLMWSHLLDTVSIFMVFWETYSAARSPISPVFFILQNLFLVKIQMFVLTVKEFCQQSYIL